MTTPPTILDPVQLVRSLDVDRIIARLQQLDGEADALRVLLRAARARQRRRPESRLSRRGREVVRGE